ncbi:uncharacterized protein LOC114540885 [Dendronephthya gigantea]|uniref:uncharacterized protein LOC114540885 n=1 Tax=Dendronephthya gigantea TaxID=151771 RepID=UPI00106AE35C|nr:uncharacterized protein LOC114540885 [Dendronephthya gigantea]
MAFSKSSRNIKIHDSVLSADCQDLQGFYQPSTLNLNDYIANEDGSMVWRKGGNFWASSRNSSLTDPAILHAECRRIDGSYASSQIDLDQKIANIDGKLTFSA